MAYFGGGGRGGYGWLWKLRRPVSQAPREQHIRNGLLVGKRALRHLEIEGKLADAGIRHHEYATSKETRMLGVGNGRRLLELAQRQAARRRREAEAWIAEVKARKKP